MYRLFKLDIQNWWRKKKEYRDEVALFRQDIIDYYGMYVDHIIIGHTHVPIVQGKLYDGGSIMATGHYIYISDDIEIKQLGK